MVQQHACHALKVSLMTKGYYAKFNVRFAPMWKPKKKTPNSKVE